MPSWLFLLTEHPCKGPFTFSVLGVHWRDWCWSWNSNTLATWYGELTHLKRPWCWERLRVGGEGDDRGWDDWMASPTQWTWVWVGSRSWWWTGRPGMLQFMGSQRVVHNWVTELNWTDGCPTLYTKETKNHSARTVSRISSLKWISFVCTSFCSLRHITLEILGQIVLFQSHKK